MQHNEQKEQNNCLATSNIVQVTSTPWASYLLIYKMKS